MEATPNGVAVGDVVILIGGREEWSRSRTVVSLLSLIPALLLRGSPYWALWTGKFRTVLRVVRDRDVIAECTCGSTNEAKMIRAAIVRAGPYPPDTDWQGILDYMTTPE